MERGEIGQRPLDRQFDDWRPHVHGSRVVGQRASKHRQRAHIREAEAGVEPPRGRILRQYLQRDRGQPQRARLRQRRQHQRIRLTATAPLRRKPHPRDPAARAT